MFGDRTGGLSFEESPLVVLIQGICGTHFQKMVLRKLKIGSVALKPAGLLETFGNVTAMLTHGPLPQETFGNVKAMLAHGPLPQSIQ